jgi:hypothetical protein
MAKLEPSTDAFATTWLPPVSSHLASAGAGPERYAAVVKPPVGGSVKFKNCFIRQRIKAGLKRAVAQGVKLGRPKIDSATERKVRKQLAKGVGILKVARSLGIGTGTVHRISNELG